VEADHPGSGPPPSRWIDVAANGAGGRPHSGPEARFTGGSLVVHRLFTGGWGGSGFYLDVHPGSEHTVDGALGGDLQESGALGVVQRRVEVQMDRRRDQAAGTVRGALDFGLQPPHVPALAGGVHADGDEGARGEGAEEELDGCGAGVRSSQGGGLVGQDGVGAGLDGGGEPARGGGPDGDRVKRRAGGGGWLGHV
jgi:hypothetical protein